MALDRKTFVISENVPANSSGDVYDTWIGAELIGTPDYNALTHTAVGGYFDLIGDNGQHITIVEAGLVSDPEFPYGDPGYYVHYQQPNGCGAFRVLVALDYTVLV